MRVLPRIAWRLMRETNLRLLALFLRQCAWGGLRAVHAFTHRVARGEFFPAFVFISVTNACSLRCQGCWVTQTKPPVELPVETVSALIEACSRRHSRFFGIMGGEPLLYRGLFDLLARHRDCYFQLFTNGMMLTDEVAGRFRALGNVTPLVSIEGLGRTSDERRGGTNVYGRALEGLAACRRQGLITGVASSVCASNIAEVASEAFVRDMIGRGVQYLWYYIYRPVGASPSPQLALTDEQVRALRRFILDARARMPLLIVDAYWDDRGRAVCPAAMGISHHVNPWGDIEPCPPLQFAAEKAGNGNDFGTAVTRSAFLGATRALMTATSRGCILLEHPAELAAHLERSGARDTSGRGTGLAELRSLPQCASHHQPGCELPERTFFYRFAKKHWFFGFGAYG